MLVHSSQTETPSYYFALRDDFSYGAYMEQRSHIDRVVLAIDKSTEETVGNAKQIAKMLHGDILNVSDEVSKLADITEVGFCRIEIGLERIQDGISELKEICQIGFQTLNRAIVQSNHLLGELLSVAERPDQTWAREKYNNARTCIDRGLWEEALEFIDKAISGDTHNPGFKLDPQFHFLRGIIFLGSETTPTNLIDLSIAYESFRLCERYCGALENELKAESLTYAAWCKYCSNDLASAVEIVEQAIAFDSESGEANYLYSKFLVHTKKIVEAKEPFTNALKKSPLFAVRAKNDGDFLVCEAAVNSWVEEFRVFDERRLASEIGEVLPVETHTSLIALANENQIPTLENNNLYAVQVANQVKKLTLLEIEFVRKNIEETVAPLRVFQRKLVRELSNKAERLATSKPSIESSNRSGLSLTLGAAAAVPGILLAGKVFSLVSSIDDTGYADFFGAIAFAAVASFIGGWGYAFGSDLGDKISKSMSKVRYRKEERELSTTVMAGLSIKDKVNSIRSKLDMT
tara:strand:- start:3 stop:1559 length:1557 start_codon:yes stop_codon:yes gene_type:complete